MWCVNKLKHDAKLYQDTHLWPQAVIPTLTSYEKNIGISLIKLKWVGCPLTICRSANHPPKHSGHQH